MSTPPTPQTPGLSLRHPLKTLCLPGDPIATLATPPPTQKRPVVRLGPGVIQRDTTLHTTKAGLLTHEAPRNKLCISNNQKRYVPALEDMVIGVVIERHADEYRVEINGTDTATLSALAFEGATKKNKPSLGIGALVYCRVVRASKNMEAEVSCVEPGSSKSWVSGETLYGELKGGNVVRVSLALARRLVSDERLLGFLGERIPFESAVGVNGRVWLRAEDVRKTVLLSVAVERADDMTAEEWGKLLQTLLKGGGG